MATDPLDDRRDPDPAPEGRGAPPPRTRAYDWSRGAWFGPLLGCTLWILVLAVLAFTLDAVTGAVALAAYTAANALGFWLWSRRARLDATRALLVQLGVTFALALATIVTLDVRLDVTTLDPDLAPARLYGALLLYPVLMAVFWSRDRAARRRE